VTCIIPHGPFDPSGGPASPTASESEAEAQGTPTSEFEAEGPPPAHRHSEVEAEGAPAGPCRPSEPEKRGPTPRLPKSSHQAGPVRGSGIRGPGVEIGGYEE